MTRTKKTQALLYVALVGLAGAVLPACSSDGGGAVCSIGGGPSICIDKSSFGVGEAIRVTFQGGPAKPKDWIAVYPAACCSPDCPSGSTLWKYCSTDTHDALATGVSQGSVTIDSNGNSNQWPLSAGSWELLYLVDDGYQPIARLSFTVDGSGGVSDLDCGHSGGGGGGGGGCTSDSECSGSCGSDCYQCSSGSCSCGYEGLDGCVF
jgi:hypothetical protein